MKRFSGICQVLLTALIFAQPSPKANAQSSATVTPHLTQAQAIQIARDFCSKIGKPVMGTAEATFPLTTFEKDIYWQQQWDVRLDGSVYIHVVDATGMVTDYSDGQYFRMEDPTPPGQPITREEAERRALVFIRDTGDKEELGDPSATIISVRLHPTARDRSYAVEWKRMFHSTPYLHEAARVTMNPETGEITGLALATPSPPLAQDEAVNAQAAPLPVDQALANTQAHMVYDQGFHGSAILRDATLQVVTVPTGPATPDAPRPQVGRIAWVVRYAGDNWEDDTWVDAHTGQVVGGESAAGGFGHPENYSPDGLALPLKPLLPGVQSVYARRSDPAAPGGWAAIKSATLTRESAPDVVDALTAARPAAPSSASVTSPAQLVLVGKDHSLGVYGYYPDTGLLGQGTDWVMAPKAFKTWMQKRIADAPATTK